MEKKHDINSVYSERNELAVAFAHAALAAGWRAGRDQDPKATDGWGTVVYVDLPNGTQVSWHMAPADAKLADNLPPYGKLWDNTYLGRTHGWTGALRDVQSIAPPPRYSTEEALQFLYKAGGHLFDTIVAGERKWGVYWDCGPFNGSLYSSAYEAVEAAIDAER